MIPGEVFLKEEKIVCNEGRVPLSVSVLNTGDRPIQVGSHFHFFEVNDALNFTREQTLGKRLNIPAGASVRFEPGDKKEIELVDFAGEKKIYGFNNKVDGSIEGRDDL
ncbi:urease subunit beta [Priestia megaterium]|uniref:urease subunit beta n=1 Tax=Priestia megaterium TaxID=1404 RepID=UPI00159C1982|nr:urease subunit beta [Priestia megaterium]